jgi:hypothetical protein
MDTVGYNIPKRERQTGYEAVNLEAASSFNQYSEAPQMSVRQITPTLQEKPDNALRMFSQISHAYERWQSIPHNL